MKTSSILQIQTIFGLFVFNFGSPLPTDVIPKAYDLEIITNLGDEDGRFDFKGTVSITIECINSTDTIAMHSKNLKIDTEKVTLKSKDQKDGDAATIVETSLKPEEDFVVIKLSKSLAPKRRYVVELHFEGELGTDPEGYYRTNYVDEKTSENKWLALTNFKPYYARKAFPCFDDPAFTVERFGLTIGRSKKYKSISSMPMDRIQNMKNKPGWTWDRYADMESIPPWLVAFAVTDFSYVTIDIPHDDDYKFPINIWTRNDSFTKLDFAREIIPEYMKFFRKYLSLPDPILKMDIIVVPRLSSPGIAYRGLIQMSEQYLFFDPEISPIVYQETIAEVVAHEMAHHWFGNIAIAKTWSDFWLIESIVKYLTDMVLYYVYPEWNFIPLEATDDVIKVFYGDSLASSTAILDSFDDPLKIEQRRGSFETRKGSYIIRMMSHFLGPGIFLKGIHSYMGKYANSMTYIDKQKILTYMTEEAHRGGFLDKNLNTHTVIHNWVTKPGIPLITVIRDYKHGTVKVMQERFFRDRDLLGKDETKWWVPLTYTTECGLAFNDSKVDVWLAPDAESVTMTGFRGLADWVIFNLEASGVYLVNYDAENWEFIIRYLKRPTFMFIPTLNRVHLIYTAANLAWVGRIPYATFLKLMEYLKLETEFLPWRIAIHCLNELDTLLKNTRIYTGFLEFARRVLYPVYAATAKMKLKSITVLEKIHHVVQITSSACKYQMVSCFDTVVQHLENLREHIFHKLDATWSNDLHEVFYCNSIKNGSKALWRTMLRQYQKTDRLAMKQIALKALGCTTNRTILQYYLELSLNETEIRKVDIPNVFKAVMDMRGGVDIVRKFLDEHIKRIYDGIGPKIEDLSTIMTAVAQYTSTAQEFAWLKEFFAKHDEFFQALEDGVARALEIAKLNQQWHRENYKSFERYIKKYVVLPPGFVDLSIDVDD